MQLVERFLLAPWRAIAAEAAVERREAGLEPPAFDRRVLGVLVLVALVMVFEEYFGDRDFFGRQFHQHIKHPDYELWGFMWWSGSKIIGYVLVPAVALRLAGIPWSIANVSTAGTVRHLRAYFVLYLAVLPVVLVASRTQTFQASYPFYRLASRSWRDLIAWELMYASTFVALELFFRGFSLGLLRRSLGPYAIFVMIVPYAMIHFGKPMAESTGAIFAGIALGTLAMATRSIWGGVLIHVAIAWTMDLASLLQTTGLPRP